MFVFFSISIPRSICPFFLVVCCFPLDRQYIRLFATFLLSLFAAARTTILSGLTARLLWHFSDKHHSHWVEITVFVKMLIIIIIIFFRFRFFSILFFVLIHVYIFFWAELRLLKMEFECLETENDVTNTHGSWLMLIPGIECMLASYLLLFFVSKHTE